MKNTLLGRIIVSFGLAFMLTAWLAFPAYADWATEMFQDTSHNFGTVARGADTQFQFVFQNKFVEDVVIESVRSSCRCTTPTYTKKVIKTWEKGVINIKLDTRNFSGRKDATVTVRFAKPFPAEVQLHSYCSIRTDVSIQPGNIAFGTVSAGALQTRKFYVDYAGGMNWNNWKIIDIQSEASFFSASMREVMRQPGSVRYEIALSLKDDAPAGYLKEFIDLVTNDPNPGNQHCPVPVSGLVEPSITIKPSPLSFGLVDTDDPVVKTIVLAGQRPFSITGVQSSDARVSTTVPPDAKTVHILPLQFQANKITGKFTGTIRFSVSSQPAPILLTFTGESNPPAEQEESEIVETTDSAAVVPTAEPHEISPAQRFFPPQNQQKEESSQPSEAEGEEASPKPAAENTEQQATTDRTTTNVDPEVPVLPTTKPENGNAGKTPLFQRMPKKPQTPIAPASDAVPAIPGEPLSSPESPALPETPM